ncbi:hypothetical protein EC988_006446 [Linderina pennispora]|nr:hypothetical protein EC988_006446 [Linderina pennispora]
MDIDDSSKNILRTSIATSLSESVGVAASDSESIMTNQSPVDTLRKDLPLPATASKETAVEAPSDRNEPAPQQTETQEAPLPDSRSVVQGLLRRIQPPLSRPPQSAIDRAKRNTVQLSGLGSVVGDLPGARNSPPPPSAPRGLSRSASTRGYSQGSDSVSRANQSQLTRPSSIAISRATNGTSSAVNEIRQRKRMTALDAICADIQNSGDLAPSAPASAPVALDNSVSTLRSSSDTAADATQPDVIAVDQPSNNDEDEDDLLSPSSSSDTASLPRDAGSAQQLNQTPLSVTTRSLQSLKDAGGPDSPALDVARASLLFSHDELPLDDWLVLLRGWNDMHDMAASTSEFYSAFLREMQETGEHSARGFIQQHVEELKDASRDTQQAIDDILGVSQGVGRRLDTLERELDDIARILVHAT